MAEHHHLPSVETLHWGYFDATLKPALTVKSDDTVIIDTVTGGANFQPDRDKFHILPALDEVIAVGRGSREGSPTRIPAPSRAAISPPPGPARC
jgi:hypothetical protein